MIKVVIFDFGGVVHSKGKTNSRQMIANLYGMPLEEIGPMVKEFAHQMSVGKIDEREFWRLLSQSLGREVPKDWELVWHRRMTEDYQIYPQIVGLVGKIKAKKIKALVLSNTIPPHVEFNRSQGWYDHFDKVYLSCEIGYRKPDVAAYEVVLNDQKLLGKDCIYIDDQWENLEPANNLGMRTILAVNPDQVVRDVMADLY